MSTHIASTSTPERDLTPQRIRHPLRFRLLEVVAVQPLSAHLTRITLAGDDLEGFVSAGFDDHVKLFFPDPHSGVLALPQAGPEGPVWPEGARPVMRDYTPRHFDAAARTLSIDFALHTPAGPATQWALQARVGQRLGVGGPKGSFVVPTAFDGHLLVGDDTALPAMARRLEELPASTRATVVIEVGSPADHIELASAAELTVQWVYRSEGVSAPHPLLEALRGISLPQGAVYAWVACESVQAKAVREYLLEAGTLNPRWLKAAGYWRQGSAGAHESFDR
jgi:NADPH-dependent ferric siderophore reductase